MAIPNFNMPITQHNTQKFDIRTRPSKYAQSDLRNWRFEQSEGIRPAEVYMPYKYLPVMFQDVNTEDYVVIPKGRVVAALSTEDSTPASGLVVPSSSGDVAIGFAASELGGAKIEVNIDSSYFGYNEYVCGLLVPANGGTPSSGFYTSYDATAETIIAGGGTATASGAFVLPANAPIGVTFTDVYQDIRGKYLNYQMHSHEYHILTDWYVEVPYIKDANALNSSGCSPVPTNNDYADYTKWYPVNKLYTYLNVNNSDVFRNGIFVTSDILGNYAIHGGSSSLTQTRNVQTVGKILAIDNRLPKGGLEDVLTYPRSGMPGSQTAGMIKVLFDFAYQCLKIGPYGGAGTAPTIEQVYNAIRAGAFGLARIQLSVS